MTSKTINKSNNSSNSYNNHTTNLNIQRNSRSIFCVRVWYRWYCMYAHHTEGNDVVAVCPDKLTAGMQYPMHSLQANSVRLFSRQRCATSCLCKGNGSNPLGRTQATQLVRQLFTIPKHILEPKLRCIRSNYDKHCRMARLAVPCAGKIQVMRQGPQNGALIYVHG